MRTLVTLVFALFLSLQAAAQQTRVSAVVEPRQAQLGEAIRFAILVDNARDPKIINLSMPSGVRAGTPSTSQSMSTNIVGGRMKQSINSQIIYPISVDSVGTYTIPSQTVVVDGQSFTTQPLSFTVTEPPLSDQHTIVATLDKTSVYVGQPVELTVNWYLAEQPREHAFQLEGDHARFEIHKPIKDGGFREPINFERVQLIPEYTQQRIEGIPKHVLTFKALLVPTQPGRIDLGSVLGTFRDATGYRTRGLFREQTYRRSIARSAPLVLNVKPLPNTNIPQGYAGLVGPHIIASEVQPSDANVGDPLTLRIKIAAPEPLDRVVPPSLEAQPSFAESFKLSPEGWVDAPSSSADVRIFETTIRATHEGVRELPPIELPYFDPVDAQYRVASSRPFPLTIRSTKQITAQDAIVSGSPAGSLAMAPAIAKVPLELAPLNIRANAQGFSLLALERTNILALLASPLGVTLTAAPPALYSLALLLAVAKRRRNPVLTRKRAALRHAIRRTNNNDPSRATQHFLADWFTLEPGAATSRDAACLLADLPPELAAQLVSMMQACEQARAQSLPPQLDPQKLVSILTRIHKELLACHA